jgi:hypothetical protein
MYLIRWMFNFSNNFKYSVLLCSLTEGSRINESAHRDDPITWRLPTKLLYCLIWHQMISSISTSTAVHHAQTGNM